MELKSSARNFLRKGGDDAGVLLDVPIGVGLPDMYWVSPECLFMAAETALYVAAELDCRASVKDSGQRSMP